MPTDPAKVIVPMLVPSQTGVVPPLSVPGFVAASIVTVAVSNGLVSQVGTDVYLLKTETVWRPEAPAFAETVKFLLVPI